MTRSVLDKVEAEGDLARGMGIVIGMFIALFAVAIALFVIEQSKAQTTPPGREARAAGATLPTDATATARTPQ
jgi:hypothetical protein